MDLVRTDTLEPDSPDACHVGAFLAPPQALAAPPTDDARLRRASAAFLALVDRVGVEVPLSALAARRATGRTLLILPGEAESRPWLIAFLARHPACAPRILVDPGLGAQPRAYDVGPFSPAMIWSAAERPDPVGAIARLVPHGDDEILRLACRRHGVRFAALPSGAVPVSDRPPPPRATSALKAAAFRTATGAVVTVVGVPVEPDGALLDRLRDAPPGGSPVAVTTERRLETALRAGIARRTLRKALGLLPLLDVAFSARDIPSFGQAFALVLASLLLVAAVFDAVPGAMPIAWLAAAFAFLGNGWLRLLATWEFVPGATTPPAALPDDALPSYSVIAAVHKEEAIVETLVGRLDALDYPRARREILIVVEEDDAATRVAAARAIVGRPGFRLIDVPRGFPRTKPRALTYALAFARGTLVAVYDAEDRPDADQLRKAATALVNGPDHLACVQARLVIDRAELALQRQFAIEYACLFDGLLPWLGRNRLPLPLGGTSNHFKRIALDSVGGWDPYNVTEDMDLAIRLARFGLTSDTIDSATREEAPARPAVWFRQRVRWIKGWITCYLVAMRRPVHLYREVGPRGFLAIQVLLGATVAAMLVHPIGLLLAGLHVFGARPLPVVDGFAGDLVNAVLLLGALSGYGGNVWLARRVLRSRGRRDLLRGTWLMPLYWIMISAAAWWALVDVLRRPHHWAKTPHAEFEAETARARRRGPEGSDGTS